MSRPLGTRTGHPNGWHVTRDDLLVVRGKGGGSRIVPTHERVWAAIAGLDPGPVVRHPRTGERLTARRLSARARVHLAHATGQEGISMHRFRHWFGSRIYAATRDIYVVSDLLGHSSVSATQGYTRIPSQVRRDALRGLE